MKMEQKFLKMLGPPMLDVVCQQCQKRWFGLRKYVPDVTLFILQFSQNHRAYISLLER